MIALERPPYWLSRKCDKSSAINRYKPHASHFFIMKRQNEAVKTQLIEFYPINYYCFCVVNTFAHFHSCALWCYYCHCRRRWQINQPTKNQPTKKTTLRYIYIFDWKVVNPRKGPFHQVLGNFPFAIKFSIHRLYDGFVY